VQVVEFASKPISVVGAVVRPGRIGATGNTTLIQAITQAGGLTANHGKELYVLRTARNGLSEQVAINIDELMVSGNADLNIPLAPNDLVNVPIDTPITIYILGEVMKPGKVQFRSSQTPTLLQAMADAGGHTDRASRYAIIKRMVNGKEKQIEVNYRAIIAGKRADEILRDNDTVVIKQALF
jgi:polysaccharide export outer membrane protein